MTAPSKEKIAELRDDLIEKAIHVEGLGFARRGDLLRHAEHTLGALQAEREWKTIETAPKDRPIEGYNKRDGLSYKVWWKRDFDGEYWQNEFDNEPEITHWRELPPPPEGKEP